MSAAGIQFEPYRTIPEHDESVREHSLVRDFEARSKVAALAASRDNLVAACDAGACQLGILFHRLRNGKDADGNRVLA